MRYREQLSLALTPTIPEMSIDYDCSGSPQVVGNSPRLRIGSSRQMWDTVVPGFHRLKKEGKTFFNPMKSIHDAFDWQDSGGWELRSVSPSCSSPLKYGKSTASSWWNSYCFRNSPWCDTTQQNSIIVLSTVEARTLQQARVAASTSALAGVGRGDSNYYESLAERKQALGLLAKPLSGLEGLSKKLKVSTTAQMASNQWLKYRYGILPLMADIDNALYLYARPRVPKRRTSRGVAKFQTKTYAQASVASGVYTSGVTYRCDTTIECRAMTLWESGLSIMSDSGFGLKELYTVPWELLPYSFVVDWFVNVGDFLSAVVPVPYANVLGSCLVETQTDEVRIDISSPICTSSSYTSVTTPKPSVGKRTRIIKTRGPMTAPGITVRPSFGFDKDTRIADAVSLIGQRLLKAFPR